MTDSILTYSNPKSKFTLEQKKKLCADWAKTNLSRSEFIRQNNLPKTFHLWCNDLLPPGHKQKKRDVNKWIQVIPKIKPDKLDQQQSDLSKVEVKIVCNDFQMSLSVPTNKVGTFIKELFNASTVIR